WPPATIRSSAWSLPPPLRSTAKPPRFPRPKRCSPPQSLPMASRNTWASCTRRRSTAVTAWSASRSATAFLDDGQPLVYGDGEQTRDFTFVENAVQANLLACEAPGAFGKAFNVGTGSRVSLNHTLGLLRKISGKNLPAKYEPPRDGDIRDSQAEIRRAREILGYEPTVFFEEGLRRTYAWYQAHHTKETPH